MPRIQIKRGLKANLPTASMLAGEAHFTTDRGTLHIATGASANGDAPAIEESADPSFAVVVRAPLAASSPPAYCRLPATP